ncbi:MAG TPA: hypothetical protein VFD41_06780 [Actinomycetales bacterium]|nr:hypothetical protein [Actinomycetales bacterium]
MIIDCDGCTARPHACADCVVTVLLGMPEMGERVELDDAEQAAVGVLAAAGLVPPLRLVEDATGRLGPDGGGPTYDGSHGGGAARAG